MYRLFYDYHAIGDVLMIVFDNKKKTTRIEKKDNCVALYNGEELIGVNILNISQIVRIKASGMILQPALEFIDVIDHILVNAGLESLPKQTSSGFVVAQILESIPDVDGKHSTVKIDLDRRVIYARANFPIIPLNAMVVVALPGTILFDGETVEVAQIDGVFFEGYLCSKKDIDHREGKPDELYLLEEFIEIGQDFFAKE